MRVGIDGEKACPTFSRFGATYVDAHDLPETFSHIGEVAAVVRP